MIIKINNLFLFIMFFRNEETKNLLQAKSFVVFFDNGRKDINGVLQWVEPAIMYLNTMADTCLL